MATTCKCFKLRGRVYLRETDPSAASYSADPTPTRPWLYVGNAPVLNLDIATREDRVTDYTQCCGGDACFREEIDRITLNLEAACFDPNTAAISLRGDAIGIAAGPKTKTFATVRRGDVLPLGPYVDRTTLTIGTLVAGTDFTFQGTSAIVNAAAPNVPVGGLTAVAAAWDQVQAATRIEMFSSCTSKEYELMFQAENCMDPDGGGVEHLLYRVSVSGSPRLDLIADNVGRFVLRGSVLSDSRIIGASPFGTLTF